MSFVFELIDKTSRKIHLTKERWTHITEPASPHAYMTDHFEEMKETLVRPDNITSSVHDDKKANYYKYYKIREGHLKVVVKYLNGSGFIITAHFVKNITQ